MVYVVSKDGKPLMPCKEVVARLLLKDKKAKVLRREPFTIKLLVESGNHTQPLRVGIDVGSKHIGVAVTDEQQRIVYMSEVMPRDDIKTKMTQRRTYRRNRRNRKTRYRAPRFNNRKTSKRVGRLPPTLVSKIHSHVKELNFVKKILPIGNEPVFEVGKFDMALMQHPELASEKVKHWGYQKGACYGFSNMKAMVRTRDGYKCCLCHGASKDSRLEVHHIVYRSNGGTDVPQNLVTLCHTCHTALHAGEIEHTFKPKKNLNLKDASQMNVIGSQLQKLYPEAIITNGYVTAANRELLNIKKEHYTDACVIATGGKPFTICSRLYLKRCNPEGDFQQTFGAHSEKTVPAGKIQGFMKFDKVRYLGGSYFIKGRMSSGFAILMDVNGDAVKFENAPKGWKTPKLCNLKRIGARKSWMITSEAVIPSIV